jgi:hypothetical protein
MTDISELFKRNPDLNTDADVDEIIAYYKDSLMRFQLGDKMAGKTKKENGPKLTLKDIQDMNLEDLI